MADKHNTNIPAMSNQISADIPDIKENLEFHKDAFQVIFQAWSDTDNSAGKFDSTTVFSDGTYTYTIPTNGVAGNAKFMIGDSSTVAWFYLNTAPPGWKALSTGADMVLAISGGSGDYNVNGGNPDTANTWTIDGFGNTGNQSASHTHTVGTSGTTANRATDGYVIVSGGYLYQTTSGDTTYDRATSTTGNQSASHAHTAPTSDATWRPKASVGKLFQLDTA
jgi:hypothetical protein